MVELNSMKNAVTKVETLRKRQLNRRRLIKSIKNIKENRKQTQTRLKQAIKLKKWKPKTKTCPISLEEIRPNNHAATLIRYPTNGEKSVINSKEIYLPNALSRVQNMPAYQVYPGLPNSRQLIKSPLTRKVRYRGSGLSGGLQKLKKIEEIGNNNLSILLRNSTSINYLRKDISGYIKKIMNKMKAYSNKMIYVKYSSLNLTNTDKKKVTEDDELYQSNKLFKIHTKKNQVLRKIHIFKTIDGYFQLKLYYGSGKTRVSSSLTLPENYYQESYSTQSHFAPSDVVIAQLRRTII